MSIYAVVLFVHVLAAFVLIGSSLSSAPLRSAINSATTRGEVAAFTRLAVQSTRLNPVAAMILLATGIHLGSYGWWTAAWFYVSAAAWVINLLLAVLVVKPAEQALVESSAGAAEDRIDARLDRARNRRGWNLAGAAMLANDLALVWIMYNKPALAGAILAIALFNAGLLGVALLRPRRSEQAVPA